MLKIGLFPLNIVLFPGSSYPLHIFEDKYRELIGEAIASSGEFGINLLDRGTMYTTGCMTRVAELTRKYPDGRMDIVVMGTTRYRIDRYYEGERSFLTADVEIFEDSDTTPDYSTLQSTVELYNRLIESVYGTAGEMLSPEEWLNGGAAYRIAQKSGLELPLRQKLLEMQSENERLQFLHHYLGELLPKIKQAEKVQMLIRNDGYLRN